MSATEDKDGIDELAAHVLDGTPVDWDGAESSVAADERLVIQQLRVLERIVSVSSSTEPPSMSAIASSGGTNEPQQDGAAWGPLKLLERLGQGANADVYRAWDGRLHREVALKLLPAMRGESGQDELLHEARLLARVRHPNVVSVYGADLNDGRVGLWTELVRGRTLEERLAEQGVFSATESILAGLEVCRAVSAVHQAGLLHRDIKAQNVMREDAGRIVLMDFGMVQTAASACLAGLRPAGGTPLYMAPELLQHQQPSVATDIYAVGVLLFHLATGRYPVEAESLEAVRAAHCTGQRVRIRDARPDLPEAFVQVVERTLAVVPSERFQSAGRLEAALMQALNPKRDESGGPRATSSARLTVLGVVCLVIASAAWYVYSNHHLRNAAAARRERPASSVGDVRPSALGRTEAASTPARPPTLPSVHAGVAPETRRPPAGAGGTPGMQTATKNDGTDVASPRPSNAAVLYSRAVKAAANDITDESLALAQEAIASDASFAPAHAWVAYCLLVLKGREEAAAAMAAAEHAAAGTGQAQRLFIKALAADVSGRRVDAASAYAVFIDLHPGDPAAPAALRRLIVTGNAAEQPERLVHAYMRVADARPRDYYANNAAAWIAISYTGNVKAAQPYAARARECLSGVDPDLTAWVRAEPAFEDWLDGDVRRASDRLDRTDPSPGGDKVFRLFVGGFAFALGRLRAAAQAYDRLPGRVPAEVLLERGEIALHRGDIPGARAEARALLDVTDRSEVAVVLTVRLLIRAGLVQDAEDLLNGQPDTVNRNAPLSRAARGMVAAERGHLDEAIDDLSLWRNWTPGIPAKLAVAIAHADVFERRGDLQGAVEVLEDVTRLRNFLFQRSLSPIPLWLEARARLAELNRKLGRVREAEAIEQDLRKLLACADADFIVRP